jgi:hypothetical protein
MKLAISIITILILIIIIKVINGDINLLNKELEDDPVGFFNLEKFNNLPKDFTLDKDDIACILTYQYYNQDSKDIFREWKKFQDKNHNKNMKNKNIKVFAVDSSYTPNLLLSKEVDGPFFSLVGKYNVLEYDGRLNLENMQKFLENNI